MMSGTPWGFWEWERIVLQGVVLSAVTYGVWLLRQIWSQGKDAIAARIEALRLTADALAARTDDLGARDAALVDCEECPIRVSWVRLQSDPVLARAAADAIARLAVERKRRPAQDKVG